MKPCASGSANPEFLPATGWVHSRKAIVRGYAAKAGFAKEQVNKGNKVA